jgi:hypothetical protein
MKFNFNFNLPHLPNKSEWERIVRKHTDLLKDDVIITIVTKNPKNRDIEKDANSNLKFPCYKVELKKEGEYWKFSMYLHMLPAYNQNMLYMTIDKDPVTRKHYPDRIIGVEVMPKKPEVKPDAEKG